MGSLRYERSLICFYTHLNQGVSNISVEDKQATSVVIGALKMKRNYYCAYRNSVNNAFLRLFCYVRTDRTMTIRI